MTSLVSFVLAHYREGLVDLGYLSLGASATIKALEKIVKLLVLLFPSLKAADDRLNGVARLLDAAAGSKILNLAAMSPAKRTLGLLLVLGLLAAPLPARAQGFDWSIGPTLPLLEVRPGYAHPVSLAPGAGVQISITHDAWKRAFFGKSWDLLDISGMAFGSSVSSSSGATFGSLGLAAGICTLSSLVCLGVGHDVIVPSGASSGWFGLFAFSFNFAGAPTAPPTGVEYGPRGLPRGNTLFFGAP